MSKNQENSFLSSVGIIIGIVFIMGSLMLLQAIERFAVRRYVLSEFAKNNYVRVNADRIQPENDKKLVLLSGETSTKDILTDSLFNVSADNSMSLNRIVEMYQWFEKAHKHTEVSGKSRRTYYTYSYHSDWFSYVISSSSFHNIGHENPLFMLHKGEKIVSKNIKIGAFRVPSEKVCSLNKAEDIDIDSSKVILPKSAILRNNKILYNVYEEQKNRIREKSSGGADIYKPLYEVDEKSPKIGDVRIYFTKNPVCEVTVLGKQKDDNIIPFKTEYQNIFEVGLNDVGINELLKAEDKIEDLGYSYFRLFLFLPLFIGIFLVSRRMGKIGCLFSFTLSITIIVGIIAVYWMPHQFSSAIYYLGQMIIGGFISLFIYIKGISKNNNRNNNYSWIKNNRFMDDKSFGNNDEYSRNYERKDYE